MTFDPDKWAEDIDRQLEKEANRRTAADVAFVAKRDLLRSKTKELWNQLRERFRQMCEAYNKRHPGTVNFDVTSNTELVVRKIKGSSAVIQGSYDGELHKITFGLAPAGSVWMYEAQTVTTGDGDVVLAELTAGGTRSVDEIAKDLMGQLLRS